MTNYWKVQIPVGKWMAGVHRFPTKRRAMEFAQEYQRVCGGTPARVTCDRPGPTKDQIARDLGLVKVKGALGGTYYE